VGTQDALSVFDPETERFIPYNFFSEVEGDVMVISMLEDRAGRLWLSTTRGLFAVDFKALEDVDPAQCGHLVTHFAHDPEDPQSLAPGWSYLMFLDREERLWLGTRSAGITFFDAALGEATHFRYDPDNPHGIADDYAAVQFQDRRGRLWISTDGAGLNIYDPESGRFTRHRHEPLRSDSLSHNQVTRIFQSRDGEDGTVWIATWGGGVNKLIDTSLPFELMRHNPDDANSLSFSFILALEEDRDGRLWAGTGNGLNRFDPATGQWQRFMAREGDQPSLSNNTVWSIERASNGDRWVGVEHGALNQLTLGSDGGVAFTHHAHDPEDETSIRENNVKVVFEDRDGYLWLGYENEGLSRSEGTSEDPGSWLHARHDPLDSQSLNHNFVRCFYQDPHGRIWVGTLKGGLSRLEHFEPGTRSRFYTYPIAENDPRALNHQDIRSITGANDGALWIATFGGGANRLDPETGRFSRLTTREGLSNDFVYAVLEDAQNHLWISTNRGVNQVNPTTGEVTHFGVQHGLQSDEFNTGAYLHDRSGDFYFGGVNGLNRFRPEALLAEMARDRSFVPPVVLTRFLKLGETIPVPNQGDLRLAHDDKYVAFDMALLDYRNPRKNRFRYQLVGFSDTWIDNENRHFVSFTNLDPGSYILRFQGANHTGIWHEGAPLSLIVAKPFWQTWWFRALMVLALGLIVLLSFQVRKFYRAYRGVTYIAHFKILKTLGKGGAGVVYLAWDRYAKQRIALKVLHPDLEDAHDGVRRFLQEAEIGSRLDHPHIVRITEAGNHKQTRYLCMEYLEGQTLKEVLEKEGALTPQKIFSFGAMILDGLEAIHAQGVVHRDLKAANMMVLPDGTLKIMDFGLARVSSLTTAENRHQLMGTLAYMSPEQTLGKGVDARADIYAFGSLLHEMLYGILPFTGEHEMELIYAIHNEPPRGLKTRKESDLLPLERLMAKCLAKEPGDRFASVAEVRKAWAALRDADHSGSSAKMSPS
jgi:ligand-binding sensor domain-containing protein/tRNA A-37 threonylcarbamoyl transferase component Bud32